MNFDWTPAEIEIKTRLTEFLNPATLTDVAGLDRATEAELGPRARSLLAGLAATGYSRLALGPAGRKDLPALLAAQEELARVSGSFFLAAEASLRLFGGLVAGWGTARAKEEILPAIAQGQNIGAVAVSEPGGSEPVTGWLTTARREGNDWIVTGRKALATNAPIADWLAVAAETEDGPAFFLVRAGQPGLASGPRVATLGHDGMSVGPVELSGVKVPADLALVAEPGPAALAWCNQMQDIILCAASLGLMRRTHETANTHARTHHRGSKPIYAHQEVRFKLADTFTLTQTAQLLTYRAAWLLAEGDKEGPVTLGCAKVFCAEAAEKVAALALQIMAGQGYVRGNPVEQAYREAKYAGLAGTTSELSRMSIADEMLRRYPA